MKPLTPFVLSAAFLAVTFPATARTITNTPKSANEQSVNGVAGPPPKKVATADDKSSAHPNKKVLKKTKVTPPPPMHDPN